MPGSTSLDRGTASVDNRDGLGAGPGEQFRVFGGSEEGFADAQIISDQRLQRGEDDLERRGVHGHGAVARKMTGIARLGRSAPRAVVHCPFHRDGYRDYGAGRGRWIGLKERGVVGLIVADEGGHGGADLVDRTRRPLGHLGGRACCRLEMSLLHVLEVSTARARPASVIAWSWHGQQRASLLRSKERLLGIPKVKSQERLQRLTKSCQVRR